MALEDPTFQDVVEKRILYSAKMEEELEDLVAKFIKYEH